MDGLPLEIKEMILLWLPEEVQMFCKLVCWDFYSIIKSNKAFKTSSLKESLLKLLMSGHTKCLEYIYSFTCESLDIKKIYEFHRKQHLSLNTILNYVIRSCSLDVITWADQMYKYTDMSLPEMASPETLQIIKYIKNDSRLREKIITKSIIDKLAEIGDVKILQKIVTLTASIGVYNQLADGYNMPKNHKRFYVNLDGSTDEYTFANAAKSGSLEMIEYLWNLNCPCDFQATMQAAYEGHLHVLVWLKAHKFRLTKKVLSVAASGGHLNVIQWLLDENCPMGRPEWKKYEFNGMILTDPIEEAIYKKNLEVITLLHPKYSLSQDHMRMAISTFNSKYKSELVDNFIILNYLHNNKCPIDSYNFLYSWIIECRSTEVWNWAIDKGYQPPNDVREIARGLTTQYYFQGNHKGVIGTLKFIQSVGYSIGNIAW